MGQLDDDACKAYGEYVHNYSIEEIEIIKEYGKKHGILYNFISI